MSLNTAKEEIIHGVPVNDPYRWLEDRQSPDTEQWLGEQQRRCNAYFRACPELSAVGSRVGKYLSVENIDQPARVGNRYFYRKRREGQEQGSICIREGTSGRERVLVDPTREGKFTSVGIYRISPGASLLAYTVRHGGEDRREIRIFDLNLGVDRPDTISSGYARGFAFAKDGYFYAQETEANLSEHTIRYHRFGSTATGQVVFRVPRTRGSRLILSGNADRLAAISMRPHGEDVVASLAIARIEEVPKWQEVFSDRRLPYGTILYRDRILAVAETGSKRSQVIELSPDGREMRTLIPERDGILQQLVVTRDRIFLNYLLESGAALMDVWLVTGERVGPLPLLIGGTIQIQPVYDENAASVFYTFESFDTPRTIFEYCVQTDTSRIWHQPGPVHRTRSSDVRQVHIPSKDGTLVPLTIVSPERSDTATSRPVIMTSYGGFGVSMTPQFSVLVAIMMELGADFAIPHIRGGSEGGQQWHAGGRARNRQSSFDDFIAAAEWLCRQGLATPSQIGIFGGSNSGLLVAAAMTQRPDLFGAVVCIAPLLDMVRYEVFDRAAKWRGEYGTVEDPEDFRALYAYSPYHRVAENVNYPATLFVAGDKDDRCNPAHVRKMAACLQDRLAQKSPVIVDYSEERGHSPTLPLSVRVPALARRIAFLCRQLHISLPKGGLDETPNPS
ncbi:MAG TPA: prolyl oligopeptidase family serine peptidase [Terracidiphilus sp.]|jgi:prolyl oligopeptidase